MWWDLKCCAVGLIELTWTVYANAMCTVIYFGWAWSCRNQIPNSWLHSIIGCSWLWSWCSAKDRPTVFMSKGVRPKAFAWGSTFPVGQSQPYLIAFTFLGSKYKIWCSVTGIQVVWSRASNPHWAWQGNVVSDLHDLHSFFNVLVMNTILCPFILRWRTHGRMLMLTVEFCLTTLDYLKHGMSLLGI